MMTQQELFQSMWGRVHYGPFHAFYWRPLVSGFGVFSRNNGAPHAEFRFVPGVGFR